MLPADVCADGVLNQRIFVRPVCARKVQTQEAGVNFVGDLAVKRSRRQPQGGFCNVQ